MKGGFSLLCALYRSMALTSSFRILPSFQNDDNSRDFMLQNSFFPLINVPEDPHTEMESIGLTEPGGEP